MDCLYAKVNMFITTCVLAGTSAPPSPVYRLAHSLMQYPRVGKTRAQVQACPPRSQERELRGPQVPAQGHLRRRLHLRPCLQVAHLYCRNRRQGSPEEAAQGPRCAHHEGRQGKVRHREVARGAELSGQGKWLSRGFWFYHLVALHCGKRASFLNSWFFYSWRAQEWFSLLDRYNS